MLAGLRECGRSHIQFSVLKDEMQCYSLNLEQRDIFSSSLDPLYLRNDLRCHLKSMLAGLSECGRNHIQFSVFKDAMQCLIPLGNDRALDSVQD